MSAPITRREMPHRNLPHRKHAHHKQMVRNLEIQFWEARRASYDPNIDVTEAINNEHKIIHDMMKYMMVEAPDDVLPSMLEVLDVRTIVLVYSDSLKALSKLAKEGDICPGFVRFAVSLWDAIHDRGHVVTMEAVNLAAVRRAAEAHIAGHV